MTTELIPAKPAAESFVITTNPEKIKGLQERYKDLTLAGVEYVKGKLIIVDSAAMLADKEGLAKVTAARKDAMKHRTACAREHEKLKEDTLAEGRRLDAWKNDFTALIVEVEDKFKLMEKAVADEELAIIERKMSARESARQTLISEAGGVPQIILSTLSPNFVRVAEDPQFFDWLKSIAAINVQMAEAEKARLAKEESDRIEAKRLADEKAEQDRLQAVRDAEKKAANDKIAAELAETKRQLDDQAATQKAAQDNIDAHNKAIADAEIKAEQDRQIELEKAKAAPYQGNVGSSWRFESPVETPVKSLAPFATFELGQQVEGDRFHLTFNGETAGLINMQLDRQNAEQLLDVLMEIVNHGKAR